MKLELQQINECGTPYCGRLPRQYAVLIQRPELCKVGAKIIPQSTQRDEISITTELLGIGRAAPNPSTISFREHFSSNALEKNMMDPFPSFGRDYSVCCGSMEGLSSDVVRSPTPEQRGGRSGRNPPILIGSGGSTVHNAKP